MKSKKIKEYTLLELVRLRPGMYIGSMDERGLFNIIRETFSFAFNETGCSSITLEINKDNSGSLLFENLPIPVSPDWATPDWKKTNRSPFGNIQLQILNALSQSFNITFHTKRETIALEYIEGELKTSDILPKSLEAQKVKASFILDSCIWKGLTSINPEFLKTGFREFSYLYPGKRLLLKGEKEGETIEEAFNSSYGMLDKLRFQEKEFDDLSPFWLHEKILSENFKMEVAFRILAQGTTKGIAHTYVNDFYTRLQGSHLDAVLKGISKGFRAILRRCDSSGKYRFSKKTLSKTLIIGINLHIENPNFIRATKEMIDNPEIITPIAEYISEKVIVILEKDVESTLKIASNFKIH